jgi:hypothetical protein
MTEAKKVTALKEKIKIVVGEEKYLDFMADLSGNVVPFTQISLKYGVPADTLRRWASTLNYRTGYERQLLRMNYRIQQRTKAREEKNQKLIKFLTSVMK